MRGFKVILLWITTHEINKQWGKNHAHGQGRTPVFYYLLFLFRYAVSYRFWVNMNTYMYTFLTLELKSLFDP